MRIGILGLGRIGAFHAETLSGLDAVDSLVVTDPFPEAAKSAAERFGAEVGGLPRGPARRRRRRHRDRRRDRRPPGLILAAVEAGVPVVLREAGGRAARGQGVAVLNAVEDTACRSRSATTAASTRPSSPRGPPCGAGELGPLHTVRSTTLDPAPPPAAYIAASGGIFRDCSVHDFDIIRWVTGREVAEVYAVGGNRGARLHQAGGRRRHHRRDPHPGRRHDRRRLQLPPQRPRLRRPSGDPRLPGLHRRRPGGQAAAAFRRAGCTFPAGPRRLLHGPLHRGLPRRTHRVHRGRGRARALPVHGRRRPGGGLDRRRVHPVAPSTARCG